VLAVIAERATYVAPWEGDFPRYAWHSIGDVCYEARLVNQELGQYKGWPLAPNERVEGL
jgi:hypothetical protein